MTTTMDALVLSNFAKDFSGIKLSKIPVPEPREGEVRIRVLCAPVNPADLMIAQGVYPVEKSLPFVLGVVGVGVVEAAGSGLMPRFLKGKRVAFAAQPHSPGSWAQFSIAAALTCVPIPKEVSNEAAVNLIANAATAVALAKTVASDGHKSILFTAGASEVGRMFSIACRDRGIKVINIVRSKIQQAVLDTEAASNSLRIDDADFDASLRLVIEQRKINAAIDSIAGEMPARLLRLLPLGSTLWSLGSLSGEPIRLDAISEVIKPQHILRGFAIDQWFAQASLLAKLSVVREASHMIRHKYSTQVQKLLSLTEAPGLFTGQPYSATAGKIILQPNEPSVGRRA
jgi:NADPH:quinone reductase